MKTFSSPLPEHENLLELQQYKDRLDAAIKVAKVCVFEVDIPNQLYTFFANSEDIFGVAGDSILADVRPFSRLSPQEYRAAVSEYFSHPDDGQIIAEAFQKILAGESTTYQARMKAGCTQFIWCKVDVTPIMEGGMPVRMIGVITDISQIKERVDSLEKEAMRDPFTGVYTKNRCRDLISTLLQEDCHLKHALIIFDLDNFKQVNDTYGHMVGDEVLLSVAKNLKKNCRKTDVIGRFGGDEFIVFLTDVHMGDSLSRRIGRLLCSGDNALDITKSMGVAIFPEDACDVDTLLKKADQALYWSKRSKNAVTFASQLEP